MTKALLTISVLIMLSACAPTNQQQPAGHDHHGMHIADTEPDDMGRQLHDMQHEMSPEMLADLSEKPVFSGYTNEQIVKVMGMMGPNYTWPVSADDLSGKYGALILVHGFGEHGDAVLRSQLTPTAEQQPTTLAIGMSMMTSDHIQLGIQDLEQKGTQEIVVVPVVSTRHNSLMRQWSYIFDRDENPEYGRVRQVASSAKLSFANPIDDHPLAGEIVLDYANELSVDANNEEVIIVGHGPVDAEDNKAQLLLMDNLADYIRANANYAAVHVATLQDDAPAEVRRQRILELRAEVQQANQQGRNVIIVTNLLGTRIVQAGLRRALRGLNYSFNAKGLIQHDNFIEWINLSVAEAIADTSK